MVFRGLPLACWEFFLNVGFLSELQEIVNHSMQETFIDR
jgi:hypothetical protein